jgi:hypothetical protein
MSIYVGNANEAGEVGCDGNDRNLMLVCRCARSCFDSFNLHFRL